MINKQYKDRMNKIEQGCKRSVDFVIAACCLVVFSPLALVCALASDGKMVFLSSISRKG